MNIILKSLKLALAAAAFFAVSALAAEAAPLYLSGHVGTVTQAGISGINLDDSNTYGVAVGTAAGPFRVEAGVDRHNASAYGGLIHAQATVYNVGAYADLHLSDRSAVYAGGGLDWGQVSIHTPGCKESDSGWGYHAAAGYERRFGENGVVGFAEARYTHLDVQGDVSDVTGSVGIRVSI